MGKLNAVIRPLVHGLHAYVPGEQPKIKGLIKLNTNENPYPPSPKVLRAIRAAVDGRLRLYPNPTSQPLREKLARLHRCSPENIIVGNGSDELLALAVLTCSKAWDFHAALTFITTPNAPSGRAMATSELEALCRASRGVVVLDEAYVDFAEENALGLALRYPHVLAARTFSKAYSLCFQRVGYFVGHRDLIAA